jgi:hypothetical protein
VLLNPQHRSFLAVVSATFSPGQASSATFECPWENFSTEWWNVLHDKRFTPLTGNIYCIEFFWPQKNAQQNAVFCSTRLKRLRQFDYWNQALNTSMRICYLNCHETGPCCYLVLHIETYYIHYSCFTSICHLFIDSPWYEVSNDGMVVE